jgi:hypothetical protein
MWELELTQESWYTILGLLLVFQIMFLFFCVSATDWISGLFLAGPIGVGPGVSGILGYTSLVSCIFGCG